MLVTTAEAAELAGVQPVHIRMWRYRGLLHRRGSHGRAPLYDPMEVLRVERATRTGVLAHYDDLALR